MTAIINLEQDAITSAGTSGSVVPPGAGLTAKAIQPGGRRWALFFIYTAGAWLLTDGLIRLLCVIAKNEFLTFPDPLLGVPLRLEVLLIGSIEVVVALICLFGKKIDPRLALVAWMSTNFVVYWIGLISLGCHPQWSGVGTLTDPLQLSRGTVGAFLRFAPGCLLIGSYALLLWSWFGRKVLLWRQRAAEFLKMSCPSCGGHIKFALTNLGQRIPCPHCETTISLRKPESLKMSCFFCQGHLEFPAHALGTKLPCPHCRKDIILVEPK